MCNLDLSVQKGDWDKNSWAGEIIKCRTPCWADAHLTTRADEGEIGRLHPGSHREGKGDGRRGAKSRTETLPSPRNFSRELEVAPIPRVGMGMAEAAGTLQVRVRVGSADQYFLMSAPAYQTINVTERWSCVFNFIRRKNSDICCARFTAPVQIYSAF